MVPSTNYNSQIQSVNACLDSIWTQLANAWKYVAMVCYFISNVMITIQTTVMVVHQLVTLSIITSASTAHRHINLIVFIMVVISVLLWSGLTRPTDKIKAFLLLQFILPSHLSPSLILRLIYTFSVISKTNLLDGLTIAACFSFMLIISKIYKETQQTSP